MPLAANARRAEPAPLTAAEWTRSALAVEIGLDVDLAYGVGVAALNAPVDSLSPPDAAVALACACLVLGGETSTAVGFMALRRAKELRERQDHAETLADRRAKRPCPVKLSSAVATILLEPRYALKPYAADTFAVVRQLMAARGVPGVGDFAVRQAILRHLQKEGR